MTNTTNKILSVFFASLLFMLSSQIMASEAHQHKENETEHHDDHTQENAEHNDEKVITISEQMIADSAIEMAIAKQGIITEHFTTYGKVVADPGHVSHVGARFEGTIVDVKVNIGQLVKKGDLLAIVEANQSLNNYPIRAPFDGIITARHANPGELAQKQPLFTVADYRFLWIELKIFPQDMSKVTPKQKVFLLLNETRIETAIDHIVPNDDGHPFILARASIDNSDHQIPVGMMAEGLIVINQQPVAIAVEQTAIHILEDQSVIFVKTDSGFEAKPVILGLKDDQFVEVKQGLEIGEQYAVKNSYVLKADLLKSGAEHAH